MNDEIKQSVFGILSHLLSYPDEDWHQELPGVLDSVSAVPDGEVRRTLSSFLNEAVSTDRLDLQDRYVRTFDFGKKSNLYLTYEQHGEERERGRALLMLKRCYEEAGYYLDGGELPDYLPLMLEFAANASWEAATNVLADRKQAIASVHRSLAESGSPYASLFDLLLTFVPETVSLCSGPPAGRET